MAVSKAESPSTLPFGVEFQKSLLKLLTRDAGFAHAVLPHLDAEYFENEVLSWAYTFLERYQQEYNAIPPMSVVLEESKNLDVSVRELYQLTLEAVAGADLSVEGWLRDQTLAFIKRNLFVAAFQESKAKYNAGEVSEAYDHMMEAMEQIQNTVWEIPDRSWFFESFDQRTSDRLSGVTELETVATGMPELDKVLGGGLSAGEMGIWIGYPKNGKSTILVNHGVQAVRRGNHNVLHVVLEGSRKMVENRYDTVFAQEAYSRVKSGLFDDDVYKRVRYDYGMFKRRLVVRGLVERWNYTVADITEELRELKRTDDWVPALIIVDYGDLMRGRDKNYESETAIQTAAFRDLKTLSNRGYAVWTASQAQRPKNDIENKPEILTSRSIANCYEKVRVADFIGTLNQTKEERAANQMRLYAELYRDNEAGLVIPVRADFSRMTVTVVRDPAARVLPTPVTSPVPLGYTFKQVKAPL